MRYNSEKRIIHPKIDSENGITISLKLGRFSKNVSIGSSNLSFYFEKIFNWKNFVKITCDLFFLRKNINNEAIMTETITIAIKRMGNLLLRKNPPIRPRTKSDRKSSVLKVTILETHLGRGCPLSFFKYKARIYPPKPPGVINP